MSFLSMGSYTFFVYGAWGLGLAIIVLGIAHDYRLLTQARRINDDK